MTAQPSAIDRYDRLIALLLLLLCALAYHRAPAHQIYDWRYSTAVSHALLHEGRLSLPPERFNLSHYQLQEIDGRVYHLYPAAPSVLNVPLLALYEWRGVSVYDEDGRFDQAAERRVLKLGAALVAAGTVALLFLLGRLFLGRGWALALALAFAFGTSLYSTASRPYWNHAWAAFFLALGLYCLLAPAARRPWLRDAAAATALSWAFFCRPPVAVSIVALTALVVAGRRARILPLALVGGGWAAAYVGFSMAVFGQPLPSYYQAPQVGRLELDGLLQWHPDRAFGTLFGPARGLFFFTPFLLVLLLALAWAWRGLERRHRRLAITGLAVLVVHWHLLNSFHFWWAGASFGPRYYTDVLPWFLVLGALAAAGILARAAAGARLGALGWAVAALLLVLPSLFIHHRGASNRHMVRHWGLWNWRFPPFMLGLVPYPGSTVPGANLIYSANLDPDPRDGWDAAARDRGFDLELPPGVGYRQLEAAGGMRRGALVFDGTGGGVTRPLQELRGAMTRGDATFEIWFRPATAGEPRQVLFETGGRKTGLTIFVEAGRPGVGVREGGAGRLAELVSPEAVSRGELSQLAVLLRATEAGLELSLWVNGRRVAGPRLAEGVRAWAGGGASGLATARGGPTLTAGEFHGEISLFRYYSAALDEKQLRRNLGADNGGPRRGRLMTRLYPLP